jgi:chemotaxis protein MotB
MHPRSRTLALLCLALTSTACVKSSTHNRTLTQLAESQARATQLDRDLAATRAERDQTTARLEGELERTQQTLNARITELGEDIIDIENEKNRLETLLNQRGDEATLLRGRIDALAALEQEVRERNRIYEEVIGRFRSLIQGGQLSVSINRGRLAINLPQDILFESGRATLGRDGRTTLTEVAKVLADIPDRAFQVEGHTDNVPIATAQFPSNWELASARALSVVRLLQEQGVKPENVSGAAYGEYQPVSSNEEPAGRRLNRRIEIIMLPNLDVIAGMPPGDR